MGTWGTNIFEDDIALDVKDFFQELIDEGETLESAIESVLEEFEEAVEDFDEGVIVILALSTMAVKKGKLTERLRSELVRIKNNKQYWDYLSEENDELYKARIELLNDLLERN